MLPNESILVVLHFTDYRTLVLAKLAGQRFLRLAIKFAEELARRRSFRVFFHAGYVCYNDVATGTRRYIDYAPGNPASLAAACRALADVIGPHAVVELTCRENAWTMPGVGVVFEAAPPLKYAELLDLHSRHGSTTQNNSEAFMSNFAGMKSLSLSFDDAAFQQFSWTFLRQEPAHGLRHIKFTLLSEGTDWMRNNSATMFPLVRYCLTLPRLLGGETLELDFSNVVFNGSFRLWIIENSGRELTFRMGNPRDGVEYVRDEMEYTIDVDDATTRYTSEKSGIIVEVDEPSITVRSTAELPRKKPCRAANEEVPQ